MNLPVLVTVPHAGRVVPFEVLVAMLGDAAFDPEARAAREGELYRQSDPHTDALFYQPDMAYLSAQVSRFAVDVNRYRHDSSPGGSVKTIDFDGAPLYPEGYRPTAKAREGRLQRYYDPFHAELRRCLEVHRPRLLIDGHSMSARAPRHAPDAGRERPAFALLTGTDPAQTSTHPSLPRTLAERLRDLLYRHAAALLNNTSIPDDIVIDQPWPFDEIAVMYAEPEAKQPRYALGLEVNRALYLEDGGESDRPMRGRLAALREALAKFMRDAVLAMEAT